MQGAIRNKMQKASFYFSFLLLFSVVNRQAALEEGILRWCNASAKKNSRTPDDNTNCPSPLTENGVIPEPFIVSS